MQNTLNTEVVRGGPVKDVCCGKRSDDILVSLADEVTEIKPDEDAETWFPRLGLLAGSLTELRQIWIEVAAGVVELDLDLDIKATNTQQRAIE